MAAIKKIRFSGANNEIHESIFVIEADDKGNTDMNTITTTGFYRVAGGSQSANHYPASSSSAWNLAVFSGGNGVIQMASYYSSSAGANKAWIRVGHSANSTADSPGAVTFPSASPYGWAEIGAGGGSSSFSGTNRQLVRGDGTMTAVPSDSTYPKIVAMVNSSGPWEEQRLDEMIGSITENSGYTATGVVCSRGNGTAAFRKPIANFINDNKLNVASSPIANGNSNNQLSSAISQRSLLIRWNVTGSGQQLCIKSSPYKEGEIVQVLVTNTGYSATISIYNDSDNLITPTFGIGTCLNSIPKLIIAFFKGGSALEYAYCFRGDIF